jgi:hypothetical protein
VAILAVVTKVCFASRLVACGAFRGQVNAGRVATGTVHFRMGSLQAYRVLKAGHVNVCEAVRSVAVLTHHPIVGIAGWRVAVGAYVLGLALTLMAIVAPYLGVLPLQLQGMLKGRVKLDHRPSRAVARGVGTEAGIVTAELDLTVTLGAVVAGLEAVVSDEVTLEVRGRFLD